MTVILRRHNFGLPPVVGGMGPRLACATQSWTPGQLSRATWWADFGGWPQDWTPSNEQEDANFITAITDGEARAREILRSGWFAPLELRLRRVVTTLVAQALVAGAPAGAPIDVSCFSDPFASPLPHPQGAAFGLRVRWYLIHDTGIRDQLGDLAVVLEHEIPRGVGIGRFPDSWGDFRYAWQSRYSEGHRSDVLWDGFLRLFVVLDAPAGAWSVRAGGLWNLEFRRRS